MANHRYEEPPLERVSVYRGPQVPVLQAYVPLPVFGAECMTLLLGMRVIGFWTLLLIPLHVILVLRTNENPFWVCNVVANYRHRWFVSHRRARDGAIVFSPHPSRKEVN